VTTTKPELPTYEEIIGSLEDKLGGLSTVHRGLGEAAQSLIEAHRELDDAKRDIAVLKASSQAILDEVRRLQPAELGATLDARVTKLSREALEGLEALSDRLVTVGREVAGLQTHADARFAALSQLLAEREKTSTERLAALDESVASSLDVAQRTVVDALRAAQEATAAVGVVQQRQDALRSMLVAIQDHQLDLGRRQDALASQLAGINRQQTDLALGLANTSEAIGGVRDAVDTTRLTTLAIRSVNDRIGPDMAIALGDVRTSLAAEIARLRRLLLVSLVLVPVVLARAYAALEGPTTVPC